MVVNPLAGGGLDEGKIELIHNTLKKLSGEVYTSKAIIKTVGVEARVVDLPAKGTRDDTLNLVRKLDPIVDLIVIFGGDGTMSDAASARPTKPLLCVGIGTTNVSPVLVPKDFDPKNLREVKMRGLEVVMGDEKRIAFNDVVVGSTILSTLDGKRVQVDAREFMKGKRVATLPRKFKARVEVGERVVEGTFGKVGV